MERRSFTYPETVERWEVYEEGQHARVRGVRSIGEAIDLGPAPRLCFRRTGVVRKVPWDGMVEERGRWEIRSFEDLTHDGLLSFFRNSRVE